MQPDGPRRRASLEVLRAEAADELSVLVHERLMDGEDPWEFMEDLPTVDELVVLMLRAENIAENGGARPNRARHYRVLRQIALAHVRIVGPCSHDLRAGRLHSLVHAGDLTCSGSACPDG